MNEGGWNMVDSDNLQKSSSDSDVDINSPAEGTSGKAGIKPPLLKKEASFAWRGGQERQTTGTAHLTLKGFVIVGIN